MRYQVIMGMLLVCANVQAQSVDVSPISSSSNTAGVANINPNPLANKFAQLAQSAVGGTGGNPVDGLKSQAAGVISSQGQSILNNLFSTDRGTTEIGATTMQNGMPIWNILLVRPIYESEDKVHTTFTQLSIFTQGNRTTSNLGLGYRQLVADKKVLLGTNTFYDYEFPYGNQRTSVGGEIRTTVGEINLNYYIGTSGWVNAANSIQEKSLGGYNVEFALAMPYNPTSQIRVSTFSWTGISGLPDTNGTQYSLTGAIWYGLNIDAGRYVYNNGAMPNSNYARLVWIFGGDRSNNQKQFKLTEYAYRLDSMEGRRYEKVRRENLIMKAQQSGSSSIGITGF